MPLLANRSVSGCTSLGSLAQFVQSLDAAAACSLHHLAGRLHMTFGREAEMRSWLGALRQHLAASEVVLFEISSGEMHLLADPPQAASHPLAVDAMRDALVGCVPGDGVVYSSDSRHGAAPAPFRSSGAAVAREDDRILGLAMLRPCAARIDENEALQCLAALAWHLDCAAYGTAEMHRMSRRLSLAEVVALLPQPCVLTDDVGRSIERNDAFNQFMEGAAMHVATGRLVFRDAFLQGSWLLALSEVRVTAVRQSLMVAAEDGRQWHVHLVPLRAGIDGAITAKPLILVTVQPCAADGDITMDRLLAETSRPLTPAESEVLNALLQGHSAKVIANARGASVNTVRSQITTILEKTGHHNQKSLMAAFAPSGFRASALSEFSSMSVRLRSAQK